MFDTLKRWRDLICDDQGLPIYMVANQATLKEIATWLPFSNKDLMKIGGFGKAKSEKYGDDIIEIVRDYCSRVGLESNMEEKAPGPSKEKKQKTEKKIPSSEISFNLFNGGKSIDEIAIERNMVRNTIESHLSAFVAEGKLDVGKFVTSERQALIKKAAEKHGWESFGVLKNNLPDDISYSDIRMTRASEKKEN